MTVGSRLLWRREGRSTALVVGTSNTGLVEVSGPDGSTTVDAARLPDGRSSVIFPSGRQISGQALRRAAGRVEAWLRGRRLRLDLGDPLTELAAQAESGSTGSAVVTAQIPGRIVEVRVSEGDRVPAGATLLVLEAMKMQNEIRAESPAKVVRVECRAGQAVETGMVLVRLASEAVE